MDELDLVRLDRELARATREWVRWRRRVRVGGGFDASPFVLYPFVSRRGYEQIRELPESDPLRGPMLRFLYRLLDDKANGDLVLEAARRRVVATFPVDHPVRGELSFAGLVERVLGDAPRRAEWAAHVLEHAPEVGEPVRRHWERRLEVAERLGVAHPDPIELPTDSVYASAEAWLDASADAASSERHESLAALVESGLGLEAANLYPAKLSPAILGDWLREGRLLDSLPLDPGPLPAALGPASFLRGLARVGAAFVDATASGELPFCVSRDPYGLSRSTHGALFAGLVLTRAFTTRALGSTGSKASDHGRVMARVILGASRAAALRVLLRRAALTSARQFQELYEELTSRAFGLPLPPGAAGAIVKLRPDDPQRFAGLLLAATRQAALTETHDEDWYRNPRAAEQLRAEAARPPSIATSAEELSRGASVLLRELSSAL